MRAIFSSPAATQPTPAIAYIMVAHPHPTPNRAPLEFAYVQRPASERPRSIRFFASLASSLFDLFLQFQSIDQRDPNPSLTAAPVLLTSIKKPAASSPALRFRCPARREGDDVEFTCGGGGGGGRLVDEGMIVLRRRIHEMQAAERNWEPPEDWAAWEKEWYATYDADVCGLVGALQAFLVGSRPAVGVGLLAVLALAVPASAFALVSHLLDASRAIISGLHHH